MPPDPAHGPPAVRARSVLAAVCLTVACCLLPLGALSAWVTYEIADTDRYVAAMAPLASEPAVRGAVTDAVTAGIAPELEPGPHRQRTEEFVRQAVRSFTGTDTYRTAWTTANRAAHDVVRSALTEHGGGDGAVRVDLAPVTEQVKRRLLADGVPFAERIPVEHTHITVLRPREFAGLRKGFHMLQALGPWLPVAAVVFAVGGILLSLRRRRAVAATALGMALGAVLLAGAVSVGRRLALSDLPPDVSRAAAGSVYDALTDPLLTTAWVIAAAGLTVAAATWCAGHAARRHRDRRAERAAATPDPMRAHF
ncbi:hypothetical protein [Streptomyces sp. NPDC058045]|uniref:hypothetical protein n=1 Tax=Streptomyces sp. NPDC058045 TaxID=3346311 RepID=UPI0036F10B39